ncbi:MAG: apolipoprotein N-acyltransferase [Pelagibacteraceae bacterium]
MISQKILNSRTTIVFIIPFVLGMLSVLSFEPFNLTFVNFIILPFLFLTISYVNKKSKSTYRKRPYYRNFFYVGYLFGIGFFLSGTFWISYSLTFDENFKFLIPFALILFPILLGLFFGFGTLAIGPFIKSNNSSIFMFCISFSVLDYFRSKILTGFPWNLWAYSWSWWPEVIQILGTIGLFAFNLLTLTVFCFPLLILLNKDKNKLMSLFIIGILFFSNYLYGSFKINQDKQKYSVNALNAQDLINLKIISPNFDLKYNLELTEIEKKIKQLIKYSEPQVKKNTLFIWPEGVFVGSNYKDLQKYKSLFKKSFSNNHIIVFGINTLSTTSGEFFNSLIAVNNDFEIIYRYDKEKLVPFGEFLPLENMFKKLGVKKITEGYGSFTSGSSNEYLTINKFNIMPLICYEIIFTEFIQKIQKDVNLIINISEDAWFGGSIGPHQHFAKAIFRAVESNKILARSANKGISAFINNNGQVIKRLEPNEKGNIELDIPLFNNSSGNKNDLIFFMLLFTYTSFYLILRKKI